jgi:endonuclease/exonuclease/phosphatase family metal-dependent hydrolase
VARWGAVRVRLRTALVLGAVVAAAVVAVPRPAPADTRLRFFDFNMCGASCNDGDLVKVVGEIRKRVVAFRPHIATLNEACEAQVERLETELRGQWPMGHVFRTQRLDDRCPPVNGRRRFGDAVFSAGPLWAKKVVDLPQSVGGWEDDRAVLCATTRFQRDVLACVVHLEAKKPKVNAKQVAATVRFANARAAEGPVLLAGDFNRPPNGLRALTDPGRGGRFVSAGPPDKKTGNGQTIDYIFLSRGSFSDVSGWVRTLKFSDHRAVYGAAELD